MIRVKKYFRCNCGVHGRPHNKPPYSNHWRLKNGIRKLRRLKLGRQKPPAANKKEGSPLKFGSFFLVAQLGMWWLQCQAGTFDPT